MVLLIRILCDFVRGIFICVGIEYFLGWVLRGDFLKDNIGLIIADKGFKTIIEIFEVFEAKIMRILIFNNKVLIF